MVIGFKKQFVEPVLDGSKIHTLRHDPHDRWHIGKTMHMATGVRTKHYHCFRTDTCKSTQKTLLWFKDSSLQIRVDHRWLLPDEIALFVKNDGFASTNEFIKWFFGNGDEKVHLKLIHWTDFKY